MLQRQVRHHGDFFRVFALTFPLAERRAAVGADSLSLDKLMRAFLDGQLRLLATAVAVFRSPRGSYPVKPLS